MSEPLAVPPGLDWGRPPKWKSPPPHGYKFSKKDLSERAEAIKHRFESYNVMWKRLYILAHYQESETSNLLEEAIRRASVAADLETSTLYECDVPGRIKRIRVIFAEHMEDAHDAMHASKLMLDLANDHAVRSVKLRSFFKKV